MVFSPTLWVHSISSKHSEAVITADKSLVTVLHNESHTSCRSGRELDLGLATPREQSRECPVTVEPPPWRNNSVQPCTQRLPIYKEPRTAEILSQFRRMLFSEAPISVFPLQGLSMNVIVRKAFSHFSPVSVFYLTRFSLDFIEFTNVNPPIGPALKMGLLKHILPIFIDILLELQNKYISYIMHLWGGCFKMKLDNLKVSLIYVPSSQNWYLLQFLFSTPNSEISNGKDFMSRLESKPVMSIFLNYSRTKKNKKLQNTDFWTDNKFDHSGLELVNFQSQCMLT